MASGTINLSSNNSKLAGKIDWWSSSNGPNANSSNVSATLYARRTDGYTTKGTWSGSLEIAGTTQNFSKSSTSIGSNWVALVSISNKVVGHNNDGSGSAWINGWVNAPSGTSLAGASASGSATVTLDKIARYGTSNQSLKSKTETSIVMNWSSNSTVDYIWYSTNNGSNWTGVDVTDGTSGTYTISKLSANTTYNIKTRCRRKDSQLSTDSTSLSVTTYNYPYITKVETTNLTIANSQKLTLYNPLSRSVTIRMNKDNASGTQLYSGTTTGTSITFTPTASTLYASIPNSQSGNCVYSAIYGSVTRTTSVQKYTINNSNCTPTFTAFTYKDNNSTTSGITGNNQLQIQNKSSLVVTASTATAKNSAKITKYTATINGKSYESTSTTINIGTISKSGTLSLVVKAVDSRGLTTSVTKNITVVAYTQPTYTVSVTRKNNYEEETTYKITSGKYDLLTISGSNKNAIQTAQYRYKESGGNYGSWTSLMPLAQNTANFTYSKLIGNLDNTKTFVFQTQIIDKLTTVTNEFTLKNGTPVMAIRKKKVGINKVPVIEKGLDIDGDINFTNTTDKIIMPGSSTDNRKLSIDTGNYNFNVSSVSGWANGMKFRTNNGNTILGMIGGFGDANKLNYCFLGGTYDKPWLKVENGNAIATKFNGYILAPACSRGVKGLSNVGTLGWGTNNNYLPDISMLAYWNGAYGGTNSNLIYCNGGTIQPKPKSLYDNSSGTTGTVTLGESSANFAYLEIFYIGDGANDYGSIKVVTPNGKQTALSVSEGGTILRVRATTVKISGNTITPQFGILASVSNGQTGYTENKNYIKIIKVIGWR